MSRFDDDCGTDQSTDESCHERQSRRLSRRQLLKSTVAGATFYGGALGEATASSHFVDILSADPSDYPNVNLNVHVDTEAGRDGRLAEDDFNITEAGVEKAIQSFSFKSTSADVVFVFDDTSSMDEEIAGMKRRVKSLTDDIDDEGIDARYALVSFKDDVETDLAFTSDPDVLKSAVDDLVADAGDDSPEDNFDAIERALGLGFRGGAQKVMVDITDSTAHYRDDGSGYTDLTIDQVATQIKESGVSYIAVAPDIDDPRASKKDLAEMTGGLWIDISGADFDAILQRIKRLVITTYVVEYLSSVSPGRSGDVSISVSDPAEGTATARDTVDVPEDVGVGAAFHELKNQKLDLADEITRLSASIDERERVQQTLDGLQQKVRDGVLDVGTALQIIERMLLAENVTEATLAGLGPKATRTPEDPDTLVGVPSGGPSANEEYDLAGFFVENVLALGVTLLLAAASVAKLGVVPGLAATGAGVAGAKAIDKYLGLADDLFTLLPVVGDQLSTEAENAKQSLIDGIVSGAIGTADGLITALTDFIDSVQDSLSNGVVVRGLEQIGFSQSSLNEKLADVDESLDIDDPSDLQGDQESARAAMERALTVDDADSHMSLVDEMVDTKETFDRFDMISKVSHILKAVFGLLETVAAGSSGLLGTTFTALSKGFGIVLGFVSAAFDTINLLTNTAPSLYDVRELHNEALDQIIEGRPGG